MASLEVWLDRNNSLHIEKVRYGESDTYYCAGISDCEEEDIAIEYFWGLVCGNLDYSQAIEYFEKTEGMFLSVGSSPEDALFMCRTQIQGWAS
jgi:hypothetical protein